MWLNDCHIDCVVLDQIILCPLEICGTNPFVDNIVRFIHIFAFLTDVLTEHLFHCQLNVQLAYTVET